VLGARRRHCPGNASTTQEMHTKHPRRIQRRHLDSDSRYGGSSRVRHGSGRLRSAIVIGLGCAAASTAGVPAAPQVIVNQPGGLALLPWPRSRRRTSSRAMSGRFWRQARIRAEPAQRLAEGNFVRGRFPMTGPPQVRRARRAPVWPASRCPDRPGRRAPRGSAYGLRTVERRQDAPRVAPRVSGDHLKGDRRSATRRARGPLTVTSCAPIAFTGKLRNVNGSGLLARARWRRGPKDRP
jgi:hypothetical protein